MYSPPLADTHLNQWANVLVLDRSLATQLVKSSSIRTISHTLILQVTLATLIANRTIKRMVRQQKLHHAFSCLVCERRVCLNDHAWLHRPRTRCHGFGSAFDFNEAHTAVASDHELFVVAVTRDCYSGLFAGLDERGASCICISICAIPMTSAVINEPSIETFLPSIPRVSSFTCMIRHSTHTYCELDLRRPSARRAERSGGIEQSAALQPPARPQQLSTQHRGRFVVVVVVGYQLLSSSPFAPFDVQ